MILLTGHFLRHFNQALNKNIQTVTPAAQQKLLSHHWPGNVRELRNVMERAVILEVSSEIQARSLPDFQLETRLRKGEIPRLAGEQSLDSMVANFEKELIMNTLEQHHYNLTRTAEDLKISRHALRYRMQRLNLQSTPDTEEETNAHTGWHKGDKP